MIDNLELLKKELETSSFDYTLDDENAITSLCFLNDAYASFNKIPANFFQTISQLEKLQKLELRFDCSSVKDLAPLANLLNLKSFILNGPSQIEDLSVFTNLLHLEHIHIPNAKIDNVKPLKELKKLITISLPNNKITTFFPLYAFYNLKVLDVRGNIFKGKLYVDTPTSITGQGESTLAELDEAIGQYYFEQKEYDKALGYYYLHVLDKTRLIISYKKLLECNPNDHYYLSYHLANCIQLIKLYPEAKTDPDIIKIFKHVTILIKESDLKLKAEFQNSHYFSTNERRVMISYLIEQPSAAEYPETIYDKAMSVLSNGEVAKSLFLYKKLKQLGHPFQYALYKNINIYLQEHFVKDATNKPLYDQFIDVLDNIDHRKIPDFTLTPDQKLRAYNNMIQQSVVNLSTYEREEIKVGVIVSIIRFIRILSFFR